MSTYIDFINFLEDSNRYNDKKSKLIKYCNKLLVKYIDHDNFEIKNLLIEFRNVIIDELISI